MIDPRIRRLALVAFSLLLCVFVLTGPVKVDAAPGDLDASFNPAGTGPDFYVFSLAVQADGKILVGGDFRFFNGDGNISRKILRLNRDGTIDRSFNPGGTGPERYVEAIAIQPDGKILIGGDFTTYNGDPSANDGIIRLNADGTLDRTFNAGGTGATSNIGAIALQPDGKILIGGNFYRYNDDTTISQRIARLNANGTIDKTFNPGGSGVEVYVGHIAVQPNGKIFIGGSFRNYNGDNSISRHFMRLNADGTPDKSFNPVADGQELYVTAMALQPDGKILVSRLFVDPRTNVASDNKLKRFNSDGTLDTSFNQGAVIDGYMSAMILQPDGKILIGGGFHRYNDDATLSDWIARLNPNGTPDKSFNAELRDPEGFGNARGFVSAIALQPDGKVLVGGFFSTYIGNVTAQNHLARLLASTGGQPDLQFSSSSYSFNESAGSGLITVSRTGDVSSSSSVDYITSDQSGMTPCQTNTTGFASERCDYATAAGNLRFAAGERSKTIPLVLVNDGYMEGPETLRIKLINVDGASLGANATATVTITDDDTQPATRNPIDTTSIFVRQQYIDFLGREPDAAGLQFWINRMTGNCPAGQTCDRIDTSLRFFQSDEFRARGYFVYVLYHATLGRRPTYSEYVSDVARLNGFQTIAEQNANKDALIREFILRPDFRAIYDDDETMFVNRLAQTSGVTPANMNALVTNYAYVGRVQTVRDFIERPEVQNAFLDRGFITMLYFGYLRRDAEAGGYNFWTQKLNSTNHDFRFLVGGFINSDEYWFRFAFTR